MHESRLYLPLLQDNHKKLLVMCCLIGPQYAFVMLRRGVPKKVDRFVGIYVYVAAIGSGAGVYNSSSNSHQGQLLCAERMHPSLFMTFQRHS